MSMEAKLFCNKYVSRFHGILASEEGIGND